MEEPTSMERTSIVGKPREAGKGPIPERPLAYNARETSLTSMRKAKVLLIAVFLAGAAVFIYLRVLGGSGPPALGPSASSGKSPEPGHRSGPLFRFGNPYLDGRSAWLRGRFDAELEKLLAPAQPPGGETRAKVHRQPFTDGPWVASLPAEIAAYRTQIESNAMESAFHFTVEGIRARELLLFLVFSDFRKRIEGLGKLEQTLHFPPLEPAPADLEPAPVLRPSELISHEERQAPVALALPTSLYHIQRVERTHGGYVIRHELWKNTGGPSHAAVHLDSSQSYLRDTGSGASYHFLSFYSGQKVPPFFEGMAEKMTTDSYTRFMEAVRKEAPLWKPSPEALRWAERALDGDA